MGVSFMKSIIYFILFLLSCQTGFTHDRVVLQLQWFPQAQFAGFLVSEANGFYRDHDLDVDIQFGGPGISPFDSLIHKKATFCTGWLAEGIARCAGGAPIVNIAQLVQRSGLMFISKKSSNILKPEDMNGKTIGLWMQDFLIQPTIFIQKENIKANLESQAYSIDPFLRGAFDVVSAMYYNEYHRVYEAGLDKTDIVTFWFADYDLNYPEDGIYCSLETWSSSNELCRKFIAASLKGWEWAFTNKQKAVDIVMDYCMACNVATSRNHQEWMLSAMEELMKIDNNGEIQIQVKSSDFNQILRQLKEFHLIKNEIEYDNFYSSGVK